MFELDFDICQVCCEDLTFSDQTGEYIAGVSECCKTGYGYPGNPNTSDIASTSFVFTGPDGNIINVPIAGVDLGYLPPVYACASFEVLTTGASASIAVVADGGVIGSAILVTDQAQLISDLVDNINSGSSTHNYQASAVGDVITICDLCGGTNSNGKTVTICPFDMTVDNTEITLSGANSSESWCLDFNQGNIDGTGVSNCFDDGVYTVTYTVTDNQGTPESYSVTKKFFFDCMSRKCLKELLLLVSRPDCPCNGKELHDKIQELRTDIESAKILFDECQYDCANELIQKAQTFCTNVCLDCN